MKVVYPGTFDPFTKGHLDIVNRGMNIFGNLTVAVSKNPKKNIYFSVEKRMKMIKETLGVRSKINIDHYNGLLSNYLKKRGFNVIIRGLRNTFDLSFELQLFNINKELFKNTETIFIPSSGGNAFISSTFVREIIQRGGDVSNLVPEQVKLIIEQDRELCH